MPLEHFPDATQCASPAGENDTINMVTGAGENIFRSCFIPSERGELSVRLLGVDLGICSYTPGLGGQVWVDIGFFALHCMTPRWTVLYLTSLIRDLSLISLPHA